MYFRCMFADQGKVSCSRLMVTVGTEAVEGSGYLDTLKECYQQSVRWQWGAVDVGYLLVQSVSKSDVPLLKRSRLMVPSLFRNLRPVVDSEGIGSVRRADLILAFAIATRVLAALGAVRGTRCREDPALAISDARAVLRLLLRRCPRGNATARVVYWLDHCCCGGEEWRRRDADAGALLERWGLTWADALSLEMRSVIFGRCHSFAIGVGGEGGGEGWRAPSFSPSSSSSSLSYSSWYSSSSSPPSTPTRETPLEWKRGYLERKGSSKMA